jgi:hypothetical protein
MNIKDANISIQPVLTKEQIAYDEAIKNMKKITARLKLSQEGIDTRDLPPEKLEVTIALFDQMEMIQRDFNTETQKLQHDANNRMMKLQEDANKKFGDVQNRYRELINSMKGVIKGEEEYSIKDTNITISKEREEKIKKELADTLARAKDI